MRRSMTLAAAMMTITPAIAATPGTSPGSSVPVMVRAETELDACGSLAEVGGLNARGQNYLSLRRGPASTYGETDRLGSGTRVLVCEEREGWLGVLVVPQEGVHVCAVDQPARGGHAYRGRCRSGWVSQKYVRDLAG